ncbi:MAG: glycoside hydrolase family 31 protein [Christensenella sp.]|nr:glycoside hydrolase family 31 protein [Christensenella sp.]
MEIKTDDGFWRFQSAGKRILRCTFSKDATILDESRLVRREVFAHLQDDHASGIGITPCGSEIRLGLPNGYAVVIAECSLTPIDVIRYTTAGEPPRVEIVKTVDGQRTQISNLRPVVDRQSYTGTIGFQIPKSTRIFGLGQDETGILNKRGIKQYLYQHNMRTPMPFFVTDEGYGAFFDCSSLMVYDDTGETTRVLLDTIDQIDCYVLFGSMDEIVSDIRYLTGKATLLPKWAFGYIQSRERYQTQDEMVGVATHYRALRVPLDCVVQDWKTWAGDLWGQKTVDLTRYPDLAAMNRTLHDMHVHSMVSIWPNMAQGGADHAEFAEAGELLGDYSTYNAFSEKARALYWRQLERDLVPGGFDAWWCDSTEPFTAPDWCGERLLPEEERYRLVGGEHKKYLDPAEANLYALVHAKGIFEHQRAAKPEKRVFNLTRSGYPGIQQYGVALWAGDTSARWDVLKGDIAKGISLCLSGIPFWTIDIGAFFVGGTACWRKWCGDPTAKPVWFWAGAYDDGVSDPAYRELYLRWLQLGAFLPLFRSHGTDTPREIWNFGNPGEPFYDAIGKMIRLRYSLMPYIYSIAMRVALEDYTMMRGLLFDFPGDPLALGCDDQFLFGDSLLVCPVIKPMCDDHERAIHGELTRRCYLPKGCNWYSYWDDTLYDGGQSVDIEVKLDEIPLFVKAGSILMTRPATMYAMEETEALNLRIYPGADCACVYYQDDGETYAYETGAYEEIRFFWSEANRQLTIREVRKMRRTPIQWIIRLNDTENAATFDGGEKCVSFLLSGSPGAG